MMAFIDQEANEKVEEIDAKVCYVVKLCTGVKFCFIAVSSSCCYELVVLQFGTVLGPLHQSHFMISSKAAGFLEDLIWPLLCSADQYAKQFGEFF